MTVELTEEMTGPVIWVRLSGKLDKTDYELLVPAAEKMMQQHGTIRMLVEMQDFHGWDASALWEDTKFAMKHFSDIDRLALVGEKKWQKGMSAFCKPFTKAEVRYFERDQLGQARAWVEEDVTTAP